MHNGRIQFDNTHVLTEYRKILYEMLKLEADSLHQHRKRNKFVVSTSQNEKTIKKNIREQREATDRASCKCDF